MKRLIAVPVLIAALAVPVAANAHFNASASPVGAAKGGGFSVEFSVFRSGNQPVGVDDFVVKRLPIRCNQGPALLKITLEVPGPDPFPVTDKEFRAVGEDENSKVVITGEFVTNRKVEGRVRANGRFGNLKNCHGSAPYVAK
jgi:hypothetical protein